MKMDRRSFLRTAAFGAAGVLVPDAVGESADQGFMPSYKNGVIDVTGYLSSDFPKVARDSTKYLIVHCTAIDGFIDIVRTYHSLTTLLSATRNAHYLITRGGVTFRMVPDNLVAYHAGLSRWGNDSDLNKMSIGVEFEGSNTEEFTNAQYRAFRNLYKGQMKLKEKFKIDDENVLYHSWVAYCPGPNTHNSLGLFGKHVKPHRGRKSDPGVLFSRKNAGLASSPAYDPNEKNGTVLPSEQVKLELYPDAGQLAVLQEGKEFARFNVETNKLAKKGYLELSAKHPTQNGIRLEFSGRNGKVYATGDAELADMAGNFLGGTGLRVK